MIKRFLSMVLCLCLLSTAGVALAANDVQVPDTNGKFAGKSVNITAIAKDTAVENAADVYSVEIVWGDMAFAYGYSSESTTAIWNPETHEYDVTTANGEVATKDWYMLHETEKLSVAHPDSVETTDTFLLTTQDAVMVFNHSNKPVDVEIAITDIDDAEELTATFTEKSNAGSVEGSTNTWALNAGTEGDVYADDGTCAFGTVAIDQNSMTSTTELTVAKLNVSISKPGATTETPDEGE